MPSEGDLVLEKLIRDGRDHYASKRYRPALESFTRAMKRCPCSRQMKRERCACKDYEKAAFEGRSIFNEAMHTCTCEVGKTFSKCDSRLHIQALDYRAATFEAMNELGRAKRDADWMLELAPQIPDGYLRLGKVARLQKKKEFAWKVYSAGIEATATQNGSEDPKVKQLYMARQPLHVRYFRYDPIELPLDIVQIIFAYLDLKTLVRCTCVSKGWRNSLTSVWNTRAWKNLCFPPVKGNSRPPSTQALVKLLSYSGYQPTQISVPDAAKFRLSQKKFQVMLEAASKLEHLEIHGPYELLSAYAARLPRLKRLVLGDRMPPRGLLTHAVDTLESVHIAVRLQRDVESMLSGPPLLNVKYLRLEFAETDFIAFDGLANHMPNVQQLCVARGVPTGNVAGMGENATTPWAWLTALVVLDVNLTDMMQRLPISWLASGCSGGPLRHLEVVSSSMYADADQRTWLDPLYPLDNILAGSSSAGPTVADTLQSMESFRMRNVALDARGCQRLMKQPVEQDTLHSIDIVFKQPPLNESPEGITSATWLAGYEWLHGSTAIRSLGLYNFRFKRYPRNQEDFPLLGFVASLPNLEVMEVTSEHYDSAEFASVIADIIKVTKLKKIYQGTVKGANLDKLKLVAKAANIELIWGERPLEWPVPIMGS